MRGSCWVFVVELLCHLSSGGAGAGWGETILVGSFNFLIESQKQAENEKAGRNEISKREQP